MNHLRIRSLGILLFLFGNTAVATEDIRILALLGDKAMLRINGQSQVLAVGDTSAEGIRLLEVTPTQATIEVQGQKRILKVGGSRQLTHIELQSRPPQLRLVMDAQGMYRVNGMINGQPMPMIVDTGANLLALSSLHAEQLGLDYAAAPQVRVNTASEQVTGYHVRLRQVQVGEISRQNVEAVVIEGAYPAQVLLGMSFLQHIQIKQEGNSMLLLQSH